MLEYILNNYYICFYFIALVLSITRYRLYYDTILKYLPIILSYVLLSEILGAIVRDVDDIQLVYIPEYYNYNTIIFNIFDIVFYLYFFYIFYQLIENKRSRILIKYGGVLFLLTCIVNLFLQDFYTEPQNYAIIAGAIVLIFACLTYLYKIFTEEQKFIPRKNLLFWISLGLLMFYICYPISMYILSFDYQLYITYNLSKYHYISIATMYLCFIIGFLSMRRLRLPMRQTN